MHALGHLKWPPQISAFGLVAPIKDAWRVQLSQSKYLDCSLQVHHFLGIVPQDFSPLSKLLVISNWCGCLPDHNVNRTFTSAHLKIRPLDYGDNSCLVLDFHCIDDFDISQRSVDIWFLNAEHTWPLFPVHSALFIDVLWKKSNNFCKVLLHIYMFRNMLYMFPIENMYGWHCPGMTAVCDWFCNWQ